MELVWYDAITATISLVLLIGLIRYRRARKNDYPNLHAPSERLSVDDQIFIQDELSIDEYKRLKDEYYLLEHKTFWEQGISQKVMPMCFSCGGAMKDRSGVFRFDPPPNIPGGTMEIPDATWRECPVCHEQVIGNSLSKALESEARRRGRALSGEVKENGHSQS